MPSAARLEVRGKDKSTLRSWVRASGIRAGLAQRARIVLLAGEGHSNTEIAVRVGVSRPTVIHWRDCYLEGGLAALQDRPRSGRPRRVDQAQVVVATLTPPPERLGVTHWSSRLLAGELGVGFACGCREPCHVKRPASTRGGGRRAGLVGVHGWPRRRVAGSRPQASVDAVIGGADGRCSAANTHVARR